MSFPEFKTGIRKVPTTLVGRKGISATGLNIMRDAVKALLSQSTSGGVNLLVDRTGAHARTTRTKGGGFAGLLGRIQARHIRDQLVRVDPILDTTDPTQMGLERVAGGTYREGLNVWADDQFEEFFDTSKRIVAWCGGWSAAEAGDPTIIFTVANCLYPIAYPMHNWTGAPPADVNVADDPEWRYAEPCAEALADADQTFVIEDIAGVTPDFLCAATDGIPDICAENEPELLGGCWTNGPDIRNDPNFVDPYAGGR